MKTAALIGLGVGTLITVLTIILLGVASPWLAFLYVGLIVGAAWLGVAITHRKDKTKRGVSQSGHTRLVVLTLLSLLVLGIVAAFVLTSMTVSSSLVEYGTAGTGTAQAPAKDLKAVSFVVSTEDARDGRFRVEETKTYPAMTVRGRKVTPKPSTSTYWVDASHGRLLDQLEVAEPSAAKVKDGVDVEVRDMPSRCFCFATGVSETSSVLGSYVGRENITWHQKSMDQGVQFFYLHGILRAEPYRSLIVSAPDPSNVWSVGWVVFVANAATIMGWGAFVWKKWLKSPEDREEPGADY